jgi:hypothetical protein
MTLRKSLMPPSPILLLLGAKKQLLFLNRRGTACRALKPSPGNFFNAPSNKQEYLNQ